MTAFKLTRQKLHSRHYSLEQNYRYDSQKTFSTCLRGNILDKSPRKHSRPDSQDKLSTWLPGRTLDDSLEELWTRLPGRTLSTVSCMCMPNVHSLFSVRLHIETPWHLHTLILTHHDIDTPSHWDAWHWHTFTLTHLHIDTPLTWHILTLTHLRNDTPSHGHTFTVTHLHTGTHSHWNTLTLRHFHTDTPSSLLLMNSSSNYCPSNQCCNRT